MVLLYGMHQPGGLEPEGNAVFSRMPCRTAEDAPPFVILVQKFFGSLTIPDFGSIVSN